MGKFKKFGLIGLLSFILITSLLTYSFASQLLSTVVFTGGGGATDQKLFEATANNQAFWMAYDLTKWYGDLPPIVATDFLITGFYTSGTSLTLDFNSSSPGFSGFVGRLMNGINDERLMFGSSISITGNSNPWPYWGSGVGSSEEKGYFMPTLPGIDFKDYASSIDYIRLVVNVDYQLNPNINDQQGALTDNSNGTWEIWGTPAGSTTPIPEPATMLLIGSGLIGLAGLRGKFRK